MGEGDGRSEEDLDVGILNYGEMEIDIPHSCNLIAVQYADL